MENSAYEDEDDGVFHGPN